MKNRKWLYLSAAVLIGVGIFFSVIGFLFGGRPGVSIGKNGITSAHSSGAENASKDTVYTLEKTKLDSFTDFSISTDYADVNIIESDGYYLEYHLIGSSAKPSYNVAEKKFSFTQSPENISFFQWNFSPFNFSEETEECYVNLYIPKDTHYNMVKVYNDSGDITLDTLDADTLKCTSDFGDIEIDELICGSATIRQDSGDLDVEKATLDALTIHNDFGAVSFEEITCKNAKLTISSGDVTLDKADFTALTINNDYGDVTIALNNTLEDYDLDLHTDFGRIKLNGVTTYTDEDRESYKVKDNNSRKLDINCDSGTISLSDKDL